MFSNLFDKPDNKLSLYKLPGLDAVLVPQVGLLRELKKLEQLPRSDGSLGYNKALDDIKNLIGGL